LRKKKEIDKEIYINDLVTVSNTIWQLFKKQGMRGQKDYKAFDPITDKMRGRDSHYYLDYYANVCKNQLAMEFDGRPDIFFRCAAHDNVRGWQVFRPYMDKILDFTMTDADFGEAAEQLSLIRDSHVFETDKRGNPTRYDGNFQYTHNYTMGLAYELDRVHRELNGIQDVIFGDPKQKGGGVRCILKR